MNDHVMLLAAQAVYDETRVTGARAGSKEEARKWFTERAEGWLASLSPKDREVFETLAEGWQGTVDELFEAVEVL